MPFINPRPRVRANDSAKVSRTLFAFAIRWFGSWRAQTQLHILIVVIG